MLVPIWGWKCFEVLICQCVVPRKLHTVVLPELHIQIFLAPRVLAKKYS